MEHPGLGNQRAKKIEDALDWIRKQRHGLILTLKKAEGGLSFQPETLRWHQLLLKGIALETDLLRSLEKMSPTAELPVCNPAELWAALNAVPEIKTLLLKKPNLKKIISTLEKRTKANEKES